MGTAMRSRHFLSFSPSLLGWVPNKMQELVFYKATPSGLEHPAWGLLESPSSNMMHLDIRSLPSQGGGRHHPIWLKRWNSDMGLDQGFR